MKYRGMIADHCTPKTTEDEVCFTLTGTFSRGGGINYIVLEAINVNITDGRYTEAGDTANTLLSRMGTGGQHTL